MNVQTAEFATPEDNFDQGNLTYEYDYEQTPGEVLELSLERKTIFR